MTTAMRSTTATIEVLTAEVRVLMVGSRQITLSVFRQLDWVDPDDCQPLGRVNDAQSLNYYGRIGLMVGRSVDNGTLVRAAFESYEFGIHDAHNLQRYRSWGEDALPEHERIHFRDLQRREEVNRRWQLAKPSYDALPLIVLAGLK